MIGRREFLQASALWVSGPPVGPSSAPEDVSGRLARLVFLDDVASLSACSPLVPSGIARAIAIRREFFLAGSIMESAPPNDEAAAIAIRAGRAALEAYRPLEPSTADARIRWDVRLLRELAARDGAAAETTPPRQQLADLFETLGRRVLIAIHTYIPDSDDVEGWMERLIRLHEAAHMYWQKLAEAYVAALPRKDQWFDGSEPIVRAAAALHHGPLDSAAVARALAAPPRSAYARSLADAHARLLEV
jgi:hypothetical protein